MYVILTFFHLENGLLRIIAFTSMVKHTTKNTIGAIDILCDDGIDGTIHGGMIPIKSMYGTNHPIDCHWCSLACGK